MIRISNHSGRRLRRFDPGVRQTPGTSRSERYPWGPDSLALGRPSPQRAEWLSDFGPTLGGMRGRGESKPVHQPGWGETLSSRDVSCERLPGFDQSLWSRQPSARRLVCRHQCGRRGRRPPHARARALPITTESMRLRACFRSRRRREETSFSPGQGGRFHRKLESRYLDSYERMDFQTGAKVFAP